MAIIVVVKIVFTGKGRYEGQILADFKFVKSLIILETRYIRVVEECTHVLEANAERRFQTRKVLSLLKKRYSEK